MNLRRLALYAGLVALLAVLGLALAYAGLARCAPPPLPGDELWTARATAGEALSLILRAGSAACFTADAAGGLMLAVGSRTLVLIAGLVLLIVAWETLGRVLRRLWFCRRGGHALLAGSHEEVRPLVRAAANPLATVFLAPDRAAAADIARHRPLAEIAVLDPARLGAQLTRLGVGRARLLAATTGNDVTNVAVAEAGLAAPGTGEILVRLEQYAVRTLSSHRLRLAALAQSRPLAVVSLTQLQLRRGAVAAGYGRYTIAGRPRVHIVLCGSGPLLQPASFEVARQGFGLERELPLVTILRTGTADFTAGALQRLEAAGIAELRVADVPPGADGLDRAIGAALANAPPPVAVHCAGEHPGEAEAIARRWEEVLLALHQPVPPIVAYAASERPLGVTGMIRPVAAPDLATARDLAHLMDRRARAVHQQFLAAQRRARGPLFGTAPAEVDWPRLAETAQDDNRHVADQMDYKLARVFLVAAGGAAGPAARLAPGEIETLARIAHARWWAAKAVAGWRHGRERDDRALVHPDMLPYDDLDEPARQKDRDEVASLPAMAGLAGETLLRERRIAVSAPLPPAERTALAGDMRNGIPVAVLPLDGPEMLAEATALSAIGCRLDLLVGDGLAALRADPAQAALLATLLRAAWRIHVVPPGEARRRLAAHVAGVEDQPSGVEHALV